MNVVSPESGSLSSGESEFKPIQNMAEEIKVVIRIRPLNERETNPSMIKPNMGVRCWKVLSEHNAIAQTLNDGITPVQDKGNGKSVFSFDKVFDERSETKNIYDFAAKEVISNAVIGRNGSIFAYGQTASGKTYTMQGSKSISEGTGGGKEGFVHFAAADLFHEISNSHDRDFQIFASVIEVYNDDVRDMLVENTSTKKSNLLKIREDPKNGLFVNAVKMEANTLSKLLTILSAGEKNRIVARTTLNKRSSRSHLIFSIMLVSKSSSKSKNKSKETREMSQVSTLNLIDLAGSESVRHRSEHSTDKRRKEGGSINKSLLTLSRVISALGQQESHIGYRDSKLTRVLQPTLSGNAKLAFICCITTSGLFLEETKSTLLFAKRIKHVKTSSKVNLKISDKSDIINKLQEELDHTKDSLAESINKIHQLEVNNKALKSTIKFLTGEKDRALAKIKMYEDKIEAIDTSKKDGTRMDIQTSKRHNLFKAKELSKKSVIDSNIGLSSGDILYKSLNEANKDLKDQVGFLSTVVEKLQGKNITSSDNESKINSMPANIRANSKSGIVSEVTEATQYGSHIDDSNQSLISEGYSESTSSSLLSNSDAPLPKSSKLILLS